MINWFRRLFRSEYVRVCPVDAQMFTTRYNHRYCSLACKKASDAKPSSPSL
jgi:hypothetical protein